MAEFDDLPIVPHGVISGVDCCGCIMAVVDGANVELRCNECDAAVGVVHIDIFRGLLGTSGAKETCPYCGNLNTFPRFTEMLAYICPSCGQPVKRDATGTTVQPS